MALLPLMAWYEEGKDPDYRFSLANERTFLAWIRTALAILAGAVVLHQLYGHSVARWLSTGTSLAAVAFAGVLGIGAYRHWRANEIAMRHARTLPSSLLLPLLALVVAISSIVAGILMLMWA